MRWQILPHILNERRSRLFMNGYFHLAILACIYGVGYYCDALTFSVRKATKLVRALNQLVQEVKIFWRK